MKTITKADISSRISSKLGISVSACESVVNKILESIIELIKDGDILHIKNFGSFGVYEKKSRPGRDIGKGKTVVIEEKRVMRFSATRGLKQRINQK